MIDAIVCLIFFLEDPYPGSESNLAIQSSIHLIYLDFLDVLINYSVSFQPSLVCYPALLKGPLLSFSFDH